MDSLAVFIGKPLEVPTSLAWFGLAADPPTLAHREMIKRVLDSGLVEQVIVFPAGKLDYKDFQTEDWQRVEMLELWKASAGFGHKVVISHFDLQRPEAMHWIDLWEEVHRLAPDARHFLVVGSDQYRMIAHSWYQGLKLLKTASFLVVPRSGYEAIVQQPSVLLAGPALEGSSSIVRGGDWSQVDDRVGGYILEHELYLPPRSARRPP